jgi:phage-related protein
VERTILTYGNNFDEFYKKQDQGVRDKIDYVLELVKWERQVPIKFLKYLEDTDALYEIRIKTTFKNIRIHCFFDEGNMVILLNCFLKKGQKTPKQHIRLAKKMKDEYFNNK